MKRSGRIAIFAYALLFFVGFAPYVHASTTLGSATGYAWGDELGWINFGCTQCTVQISNTGVTGYIWSSTAGWINLSPANAGVVNDGQGTLSGYAWSSSLGWINFSGVSITTAGNFSGIAGTASSSAGRITFSCSYCNVTTDWRPLGQQNQQNQPPVISGGGGGTMGSISSPAWPGEEKDMMSISSTPAELQSIVSPPPSNDAVAPPGATTIMPSQDGYISNDNNPPGVLPANQNSDSIFTSSTSRIPSLPPSYSHSIELFFYILIAIGALFFIIFARHKK